MAKCVWCKKHGLFLVVNKHGFCKECNTEVRNFIKNSLQDLRQTVASIDPIACINSRDLSQIKKCRMDIDDSFGLLFKLEEIRPIAPFFKSSTDDLLSALREYKKTIEDAFKVERFHIAGTSFRQKEIEQMGSENNEYFFTRKEVEEYDLYNQKIYYYDFYPSKVELTEEPDNPYDPNAIKVIIDDVHVGYIKKGSCSHVKKIMHSGVIKNIDAEISGGKYKEYLVDEEEDEEYRDRPELIKDKEDYFVTIEICYLK